MEFSEKYGADEFYPTPRALLERMTEGIRWRDARYVLEPSAGKGDIALFVQEKRESCWCTETGIDCIEKDPELRMLLEGKGLRVVHDDFLTYRTLKKYDLIIMNPPFSEGEKHLAKALDMAADGGAVVCVLNAQTLRNPHTNARKALAARLEELGAEIIYEKGAFAGAEHRTDVEIAVVRAYVPEKEHESMIFSMLKKRRAEKSIASGSRTDVAPGDFVEAAARNYEMEAEAGLTLLREHAAMAPKILDTLEDGGYSKPLIELRVGGKKDLDPNRYLKLVRRKYWTALFMDERFTGGMASAQRQEYASKVGELAEYDFSTYNIRMLQIEMSKNLVRGIEDCIVELFDELSVQYSYSNELSKNIHYYNGWKTNKSWIINKKVIVPFMDAWGGLFKGYEPDCYRIRTKLGDIEKALDYLDGGRGCHVDMGNALKAAKEAQQTKKIRLKHFDVTFYKKGTCHIEFRDAELLKKFNIFGSQQKGWLPPSYGRKEYAEMDGEERAAVDGFEGEKEYARTLAGKDWFIYDSARAAALPGAA